MLKEEVFGTLYLSIFRFSLYADLKIAIVKRAEVYSWLALSRNPDAMKKIIRKPLSG